MSGIVDTTKLVEARTTFSQAFNKGLTGTRTNVIANILASEQASSGAKSKYPIVGGLQRFREFLGERVYQDFGRYAYELANRTFIDDVEVSLDDFEDEQYGGYITLFEQLGQQASQWQEDLLIDALKAGETEKSYDDVAFFSATHKLEPKVASTAYSNLFTGTALTEANFDAVYTSMETVATRDGRFTGFGKDVVLVVPPQLETTGKKIVQASQNAQGATNVLAGKARVLKIQDLGTAPTEWYLADVGNVLKPLLFQMRKAPRLLAPRGTEDYITAKRVLRWHGEARGAAGYCAPWLMAKAKA